MQTLKEREKQRNEWRGYITAMLLAFLFKSFRSINDFLKKQNMDATGFLGYTVEINKRLLKEQSDSWSRAVGKHYSLTHRNFNDSKSFQTVLVKSH